MATRNMIRVVRRFSRLNILPRMGSFTSTPRILNEDILDHDVNHLPKNISRTELLQHCQRQPKIQPMVKRMFRKARPSSDFNCGVKVKKLNAVSRACSEYTSGPHNIRVLQWNILSQALGQMNDNFAKCPDEALEWNSRRYLIIEELVEYCPDIICLQSHFWNNVTASYPYGIDHKVVLVPRPKKVPQYEHFLKVFDVDVIFLNFLATFGICYVLYMGNRTGSQMGVTDYFFNYLLQILFNSSMPNLDKITGYVKYLLMLWVFCMSVNNTQFNSLLTSMLVSSRSKEPIKTIEELSKSNFRIYVHEYFVGRGYIPNSLGLDQKLIRIDEQPENMLYSNVTIGNQYAFVVRIDAAKFFINSHRNKDGQSQYAIMKESLIPGIDGYTLQKNSPLVNQFNKCLLLIKQHGLINFQSSSNYGKAKPNQPENLNIKHLLSLVGLYLVGNCFAFLVFIAEVLWKKYKT